EELADGLEDAQERRRRAGLTGYQWKREGLEIAAAEEGRYEQPLIEHRGRAGTAVARVADEVAQGHGGGRAALREVGLAAVPERGRAVADQRAGACGRIQNDRARVGDRIAADLDRAGGAAVADPQLGLPGAAE